MQTVNIIIPAGGSAHLTPLDQTGAAIPIAQCTLLYLPASIATSSKDATGFNITAVAPGSYGGVRVSWYDGANPAVQSGAFAVTVQAPPPAVTAVGTTSP